MMRTILILLAMSQVCAADVYLRYIGGTEWREFKTLDELPSNQMMRVVRVTLEGVPAPDPEPPVGLRGEISAAVKKANDQKNTSELYNMVAATLELIKQGLPLVSAFQLLESGESLVLDTATEKQAWASYSAVTSRVYKGNPRTLEQIQQMHLGLKDNLKSRNGPFSKWKAIR